MYKYSNTCFGYYQWNNLMLLQCLLYSSSQLHGLFGTGPGFVFWIFIWILLVKFSCDGSHKISIWYAKLYRDRWMKFLCSSHQHCWHPRLFLIKLVSLDKSVIGMIRGLLLHNCFQSIPYRILQAVILNQAVRRYIH